MKKWLLVMIIVSAYIITQAFGIIASQVIIYIREKVESILSTSGEQGTINNLIKLQSAAAEINTKVDRLLEQQSLTLNLLKNLPDILQNLILKNDLRKHIVDLNTMYAEYQRYFKHLSKYDTDTLVEYAEKLVSHTHNSVEVLLAQIHSIISPPETALRRKGILDYLANDLRVRQIADCNTNYGLAKAPTFTISNIYLTGNTFLLLCQMNMSAQLSFYNFYAYLAYAKLRGATMKIFGYTLLSIFENGTYTSEINLFHDRYRRQMKKEYKLVKKNIGELSPVIWQCDPPVHVRGETFIEVTQLYQGYIINQYDIIRYNCRYYCYDFQTFRELSCTNTLCQFQRRCAGTIFQCGDHFGSSLTVYLRNPQMNEDRRRYSYAKATDHLGNLNEIKSNDVVKNIGAWWYDHHRCDYCLCKCDDRTNSDRYFNLRPTIANIQENHVVTGLRFVKKNRIIYLQIQEGKLMANGTIDRSTITWVPVDGYKLSDKNVKEGVDYHGLYRYHDHIHFDDLLAEEEEVIVGVRLTLLEKSKLALSIATVDVEFSTGVLTMNGDQPNWFTIPVTASRRFFRNTIGVSYFPNSSSTPYDYPSWTYFESTSWASDTAQTTVPSLDAQPVVSAIPLPLQGAGLYYKSQRNHGGFIAPKIIPYNIVEFL